MADEPPANGPDRNELLLREAAKLMGMLFVGRKDAYAFHTGTPNGQWVAVREKYKLGDFRNHLFGDRCLGAYLLTPESTVRCMAFDVDLKKDAPYHLITDVPNDDHATLDLDTQRGNVEAALHDPESPAHRWACSLVASTVEFIRREVYDVLGLTCTTIVTGGGAHVFVPFGHEMPAAEARAMGHTVMEGLPIFHRRSESFYANSEDDPSVEIEVFPKQDSLTDPDSLGNLIRLPFGRHEIGMRTYALDPKTPKLPSWKLPKISSIDSLRLQAACLDLEWELLAS